MSRGNEAIPWGVLAPTMRCLYALFLFPILACAAAAPDVVPDVVPDASPPAVQESAAVDWKTAVEAEAAALEAAHPGAVVRIVVLDASGVEALAEYGDVRVPTPTASTIKPLTIFAALAVGLDPELKIDASTPLEIDGQTIEDVRNNGVMTLPQAMAKSSNIAVARSLQTVAWRDVYARVRAMVPLPDPAGMDMREAVGTLGGNVTQVPLRDLVGAYAKMAGEPGGTAVLDMLRLAVTAEGTGERAAVPGLDVLGKTGTARDDEQYTAVFVGRVIGKQGEAWIGVHVGGLGPNGYGGSVAAPAFAHIAQAVLSER